MARVRAPELVGAGGWIGVPDPLSLAQLTGRLAGVRDELEDEDAYTKTAS